MSGLNKQTTHTHTHTHTNTAPPPPPTHTHTHIGNSSYKYSSTGKNIPTETIPKTKQKSVDYHNGFESCWKHKVKENK